MNRREFAAALGGVVVALNLPAIPAPPPTLAGFLRKQMNSTDDVGFLVPEDLAAEVLEAKPLLMLPTEGIQEISIRCERIETTSLEFDAFRQFVPGPQYVEISYWTEKIIPELRDATLGECRLEAFGYRIDGYLKSFNMRCHRRGFETYVEMFPTSAIVQSDEYEHRKGRRT